MKKLIVGIVVIVAIVIAAAPFVSGLMMEKMLAGQKESYAQRYGNQPFYPKVEIASYQRGYLSSQIEWAITLPDYEVFAEMGPIVISETAQHGLTGVTTQASLTKNSWYNDFINEKLAGNDPFAFTGEYSLFSGATGRFVTEAFDLPIEDGVILQVKAGQLTCNTDSSLKKIKTSANFAGFAMADILNVEGIALESDTTAISGMIMAGTGLFSMDSISINNPDNDKRVSFDGVKVSSNVDYDAAQDRLSIATNYRADHIVADKNDVKDAHLGFAVNNLDATGVNDFYQVYSELLAAAMEDMGAVQHDPQQAQMLLMQKLESARMRLASEFEKLLKKDLEIKISDVQVVLPEGKVTGDLAIGLKKDMSFAGFMVLLQQPQAVVDIFSFESNARVAKELVPAQEQLVNPFMPAMQSGVFEADGEQLVHHAQIKDDKLLLNGKEFLFENL